MLKEKEFRRHLGRKDCRDNIAALLPHRFLCGVSDQNLRCARLPGWGCSGFLPARRLLLPCCGAFRKA